MTIKPWLRAVRDLFIPVLPSFLVKWLVGNYDFAFIAHPLVLEDLSRQYPNLVGANKEFLKFVSKYLWPVTGSNITGFRNNQGKELKGIVLFCPMSTRLLVLRRKSAIRKIIRLTKIAEKLQVRMVGLGAFIPIVTHDGKILAKKSNLNMTTGTAFSSIIATTNAITLASSCGIDFKNSTVAVVGAGGSVGSICSRLLLDHFNTLVLIDKSKESLDSLLSGGYLKGVSNKTVYVSTKVETVKHASLVIVATNSPGIIVRSDHIKPGALIVDAAQPRNVSAKIPFIRKDVIVVESGIAEIKGLNTNFQFDLKSYSEVYSCLAEVLILLWLGIRGQQVGSFDMSYVYALKEAAIKIGIEIPRFRNRAGYVTDNDISHMKDIIGKCKMPNSHLLNGQEVYGSNRILELSV